MSNSNSDTQRAHKREKREKDKERARVNREKGACFKSESRSEKDKAPDVLSTMDIEKLL